MIAYLAGVCEKKRARSTVLYIGMPNGRLGNGKVQYKKFCVNKIGAGGCMFDRSCKRDPGVKRKSYLRTCIFRHDRAIRTYHNSGLGTTLAK
jgi:hypothetical protein